MFFYNLNSMTSKITKLVFNKLFKSLQSLIIINED